MNIIDVKKVSKVYSGGFEALKGVDLSICEGEIFALLGPNGAGKTTLISIICGLVNLTEGNISVGGNDILKNYKEARRLIGLVPQELTRDAFETVWNTVNFSRGIFGLKKNHKLVEKILKDLSLWDKKDNRLMTLSGGMKRRVMIAKALSHEPKILFLDEPTAGVDVELRKSMWNLVRDLRKSGVTIILTTHYIEEAEEMADRIGVISKGKIILVEQKTELMKKLGKKELVFDLTEKMTEIPIGIAQKGLSLEANGLRLKYSYDSQKDNNPIGALIEKVNAENINYKDIFTKQSSLEEIFVSLVSES